MDLPMMEYAFFQGRIVPFADAKISIGTHTVQYGTGAFAGIRGYLDDDGGGDQHLPPARPRRAAPELEPAPPCRAALRPRFAGDDDRLPGRANAPTGDVYIRPFVYKSALQLTPRLRGLGDELAIYMLPMGDYLKLDRGQRAIVSSWSRIPDNAIPSRGKLIGAYVNSAFAKDEAEEKGADEAIMLNTAGKVAEGSGCNLFIVRNDTLITPPITGDILEGITRRSMLRMASDAGIRTEEREIDRTELYVADEAFFCGTGVQVAWIEAIDGRSVGKGQMGPITTHLRATFFDTVRGRSTRYADWITRVRVRDASPGMVPAHR